MLHNITAVFRQVLIKFKFFTIVSLTMIVPDLFSQKDSVKIPCNVLFIELGGAGGIGSINYERVVFVDKQFSVALRSGLASYHLIDYTNEFNPDILAPVTINAFYGKQHKMELGVGQTVANTVYMDDSRGKRRKTNFNAIFSIGYRYQKNKGKIIFQLAYTPILEFNRYYRHWGGICFGYLF